MIPLDECVDRGVYEIRSRNLAVGVFRKATGGFIGIREKFGSRYLFEEYHWESPAFATVRPVRLIEMLPDGIEVREYEEDPDKLCGEGRATYWKPDDPSKGRTPGKRYHVDDDSRLEYADYPNAHLYRPLFDYLEPIDKAVVEAWENSLNDD